MHHNTRNKYTSNRETHNKDTLGLWGRLGEDGGVLLLQEDTELHGTQQLVLLLIWKNSLLLLLLLLLCQDVV